MKIRGWGQISFFSLLAVALGIAPAIQAKCPDPAQGETKEDCPWAQIARGLIQQAESGKPPSRFDSGFIPLFSQLRSDAQLESWKALWGESINFDEIAKTTIVHPAILRALSERLRIPYSEPAPGSPPQVHAGMEHTYGYLFSLIHTPFGFKRARWVRGEIERTLGIPPGLLGPTPPDGTLFANATYLAGRIAFRSEERELAALKEKESQVSPAIRELPYDSLEIARIREETDTPSGPVVLRTDLVSPRTTAAGASSLLIYSVSYPARQASQLITMFPVKPDFVEKLLDPKTLGKDQPITTHYNGYVPGLSGTTRKGTRTRENRSALHH